MFPYLRILTKEAAKAKHPQHRMSSMILRGGNIIAIGHNFATQHAEVSALNRAWRSDIEGAMMVVIRVRKDGNIGLARPCSLCAARLAEAGIKRVMYSDETGMPVIMNIDPGLANTVFHGEIQRRMKFTRKGA